MDWKWACKTVQFSDTIPANQNPDGLKQKEVLFTDNTANSHSNLNYPKRETLCWNAGLSFPFNEQYL
jgi:hypothetical protein